jgi:hypothetical protein
MTRVFLTLLTLCLAAVTAHAQSFVTVRPEPAGHAWWLRAEFRALEREVRGIPVGKIRAGWCKATEFTREKFPKELLVESGTDLLDQAELKFSLEGSFDGSGVKQTALVGVYETCAGKKGRFFLMLDAATGKVRFLDAQVAEDRFSVLKAEGRNAIRVFYCLECDASSVVRFERARKRFVIR